MTSQLLLRTGVVAATAALAAALLAAAASIFETYLIRRRSPHFAPDAEGRIQKWAYRPGKFKKIFIGAAYVLGASIPAALSLVAICGLMYVVCRDLVLAAVVASCIAAAVFVQHVRLVTRLSIAGRSLLTTATWRTDGAELRHFRKMLVHQLPKRSYPSVWTIFGFGLTAVYAFSVGYWNLSDTGGNGDLLIPAIAVSVLLISMGGAVASALILSGLPSLDTLGSIVLQDAASDMTSAYAGLGTSIAFARAIRKQRRRVPPSLREWLDSASLQMEEVLRITEMQSASKPKLLGLHREMANVALRLCLAKNVSAALQLHDRAQDSWGTTGVAVIADRKNRLLSVTERFEAVGRLIDSVKIPVLVIAAAIAFYNGGAVAEFIDNLK